MYTGAMNIREGNERLRITLELAVEAGKREALARIKERCEGKDSLDYHNTRHTEKVVRRSCAILAAIYEADKTVLDERRLRLGAFAAAWHDVVQNCRIDEAADGAFTRRMRKCFTRENEAASAEEAIQYMREKGGGAFRPEDEETVRRAILATVPAADFKEGTMVQENLAPESDVLARAVALADLGCAGMDGTKEFIEEGNAVFREDAIDIRDALRSPENISEEQKSFFTQRMLAWSRMQEKFAAGRKALFEAELGGLSEEARRAVRALFDKFDESIEGAHAKTEERKKMTFEDLIRDFGYSR